MIDSGPDQPTAGVALVFDREGTLRRVLRDDLGLAAQSPAGRPFPALVDGDSAQKAASFLVEIRNEGAAFNWELNVRLDDKVTSLAFSGVATGPELLIAGAATRDALYRLFENLVAINNEQANALRQAIKDHTHLALTQSGQSTALYDELSRLNNELVALQRELARQNAELERLNELKNQFLGTAAHDLRNPLFVVQSCSKFLLSKAADRLTEEQLEFLTIIRSYSDFMLQMVDDLLDVSAIESGRLELHPEPTDLVALVRRNVSLNSLLAESKGIQLSFREEGALPPIIVDPVKMEQVLNNLISNAIKFSAPGSPVRVRVSHQGGEALIAVEDKGPGIPPVERDKLFRWFGRTSVRSTAGERSVGLGLAISHRIVSAHQGRIWLESEVGSGSTFYVSLPLGGEAG